MFSGSEYSDGSTYGEIRFRALAGFAIASVFGTISVLTNHNLQKGLDVENSLSPSKSLVSSISSKLDDDSSYVHKGGTIVRELKPDVENALIDQSGKLNSSLSILDLEERAQLHYIEPSQIYSSQISELILSDRPYQAKSVVGVVEDRLDSLERSHGANIGHFLFTGVYGAIALAGFGVCLYNGNKIGRMKTSISKTKEKIRKSPFSEEWDLLLDSAVFNRIENQERLNEMIGIGTTPEIQEVLLAYGCGYKKSDIGKEMFGVGYLTTPCARTSPRTSDSFCNDFSEALDKSDELMDYQRSRLIDVLDSYAVKKIGAE